MKKITLAAIVAVMLSAGLTSQTKAQSKAINIENLSAATFGAKSDVVIKTTPVYNKAGKLLYTVKRYEADALPKDINRSVRNQFYDFDIIGVEEVVLPSNGGSIYFVHIGNETKIKTVKIFNDELEVVEDFKRG